MELLGRELGTHWADFGNVEPNPNRTMPWSGRRLLSTRLLTRAQCQHWSHFDPKPSLRSRQGPAPQVAREEQPKQVYAADLGERAKRSYCAFLIHGQARNC